MGLQLNMLTLLFLVTTVPHTQSVSSTGFWLEKCKDLKVFSQDLKNGLSCQICSSTVTWKRSVNKRKKRKKLKKMLPLKSINKKISLLVEKNGKVKPLKTSLNQLLKIGLLL